MKPSMQDILQAAKDMQTRMEASQKNLENLEVEATAGPNEAVKLVANGHYVVQSIRINPQATDDVEALETYLKDAFNRMVHTVAEAAEKELSQVNDALPWS